MARHHYIKCEANYYQAIERGEKKFEVRKNDRDYRLFDSVFLEESANGVKTGRFTGRLVIRYILYGPAFGLPEGYCIFNW